MRIGWNARELTTAERNLVTGVFGPTLPNWKVIMITDGLGLGDAPWTDNPMDVLYSINMGPEGYKDCTSTKPYKGFGNIDAIFVHEMTHVWQYKRNYNVKLSSVWAQTLGDGYKAVPGDAWDDYNVEQQASLVEDWYAGGKLTSDDRYPYIEKVVRKGGGAGTSKKLADLKKWTP